MMGLFGNPSLDPKLHIKHAEVTKKLAKTLMNTNECVTELQRAVVAIHERLKRLEDRS
jgi:hypothetical protein